jgi:cytosine/adenosine deaminase-related metal-dependent hydrolase
MTAFGIRATFLDFIEDPWRHVGRESEAARFYADGLLVVEDGRIADFGAHDEVAARHAGLVVTTISDRLILPGFIDGHVHFPQTRVIGAFGEHLLPWLQKWVFPEEIKFKDRAYACEAAGRFFDNLLASGTTTCQAFTTTASAATEELFDDAARRNMRLIAGLTGIDRLAPADYALSAENFYRDSKRLIERCRRQGRGLYAITPRNAHVMANNAMLDDPAEAERNKLSAYRGFWSITLGGAEGLYIDDLVGNFAPGKEADFVVLDCNGGPPALAWRQSLIAEDGKPATLEQAADLLFGLMVVGDDRAIEQTWAMGRQVYLRRGSN